MKRSKPLRADPEKARDWQQRSAAKAQENARERDNGRPPVRRKSPQNAESGRQPEPKAKRKKKGPVQFRSPSSPRAHLCPGCLGVAAQWHHWLPQQHIRVYVRGLRLPEPAARRVLHRLLHDRRNFSAVCAGCHGDTPSATAFSREDVPDSAHVFAAELGAEWVERLRTMYPSRRGR